jgi:hypothetical protein
MGCLPIQVPGSAVTTDPVRNVPRNDGALVCTGGPTTVPVGFEAAVAEPSAFVAVTRARSRNPTSAAVRVYLEPVAPEIAMQSLPSGCPPPDPQRTQRYA